jgi:hypothetical protein
MVEQSVEIVSSLGYSPLPLELSQELAKIRPAKRLPRSSV